MKTIRGMAAAALATLALAGCATIPGSKRDYREAEAALSQHIRVLASEEYGGREPGTPGGVKTEQYLIDALQSYGFQPGAAGEWRQPVKLARFTPGATTVSFATGEVVSGPGVIGRIASPSQTIRESRLSVVAPGEAMPPPQSRKGRSVLMFGEALFAGQGQALAQVGYDAIFVAFEDLASFERAAEFFRAGRWGLAEGGELATPYILLSPADTDSFVGAVDNSLANLRELAERQEDGEFQLRHPLSVSLTAEAQRIETANIIGKLPGRIPNSGAVLILSHWDHLGTCGDEGDADRLCNGAIDNASGVGVMLEVARRVAAQGGLDRDLYVMGTTAEEMGLFGAEAFALNPPFPLPTIVAAFNMDSVAIAPRGAPATVVGWGRTPLDEGIRQVVESMGTEFKVLESTEQFVRRQDGWALLSRDVPAVLVSTSFGDEQAFDAFLQGAYHRADDEWREDLELGGATDDIFLHVALLRHFGSVAAYQPGAAPAPPASQR